MTEKITLNITEAAEALNISRASLYNLMAAENDFPVVRLGGRRLVPVDGLKRWIESHTEGSAI